MSPQERDDELLEEYLRGESRISRLYRRDADEQPDPRLDARILSEARRAVARKSRVVHGPFARHWTVPASLAAVLVVAVSVVLLFPDPAMEPGKPAAVGDDARGEFKKEAAQKTSAAPEPTPAAPAEPALRRDQLSGDRASEVGGTVEKLAEPSAAPRRHGAESLGEAAGAEREAAETRDQAAPPPAPGAASAPLRGALSRPQVFPPPEVRDDPQEWLRHIEALLAGGFESQARDSLRAFRARYPDHPLPERLRPLARTLDEGRR